MRFAYADPPYLGLAEKFYGHLHGSGAIHFESLRPYVGWDEFCGEWEQKP